MKKTLYSLNPSQYPDIEIDFIPTTAEKTADFADPEIIEARKTAVVQARKLTKEEKIDSRPRVVVDSKPYVFTETTNTAPAGSWVITNPDGEDYVIKDKYKEVTNPDGTKTKVLVTADEQFQAKYQPTENGYIATEGPKKFRQVSHFDICFEASWGETQFAPKGSYICIEYGPGEEYSVTNSAFESTYQIETPVM